MTGSDRPCRVVVRSLCARHLHTDPAAVGIDQTSTGKPYLTYATEVNSERLEFSVTHSGDYVLVAWSQGQSVGVDVEALDRNPPALFDDVAASAFSRAERAALSAAAPDRIAATFYRIWVRKEAVLKAEHSLATANPQPDAGRADSMRRPTAYHSHLPV